MAGGHHRDSLTQGANGPPTGTWRAGRRDRTRPVLLSGHPGWKSAQGAASTPSLCLCLRGRPASRRSNTGLGSRRSNLATTPICQGMTR